MDSWPWCTSFPSLAIFSKEESLLWEVPFLLALRGILAGWLKGRSPKPSLILIEFSFMYFITHSNVSTTRDIVLNHTSLKTKIGQYLVLGRNPKTCTFMVKKSSSHNRFHDVHLDLDSKVGLLAQSSLINIYIKYLANLPPKSLAIDLVHHSERQVSSCTHNGSFSNINCCGVSFVSYWIRHNRFQSKDQGLSSCTRLRSRVSLNSITKRLKPTSLKLIVPCNLHTTLLF